jgi:ADP-heptose:LPS heptosyltransferase
MSTKKTKRALVVRHGAHGDAIIMTCLFPYLVRDGYEVHALVNDRTKKIIYGNPNISQVLHFEDNVIPLEELGDYYDLMGKDYDKTVILTQSIEAKTLIPYPMEEYFKPIQWRRKHLNTNYYEDTIRIGGYEPDWIKTGQLYFMPEDIIFMRNFRNKHKKDFIIMWALAGSSIHKGYLHYEEVARRVLDAIPNSVIVACGEFNDMVLSFRHPRVWNTGYNKVDITKLFALTKVADLVIGPETAIINAAGCFRTPKICMLTHSSKENLTKNFVNDFSIQAQCACSPCHILHKYKTIWKNICMVDKEIYHNCGKIIPACTGEGFPKEVVFQQIMKVYQLKKEGKLQ